MKLIDRLRRWFATRPRMLVLAGLAGAVGTVALSFAPLASAQNGPAPSQAAPPPAPPAEVHVAPPAEQHAPPAEHAPGPANPAAAVPEHEAAHGAPAAEGSAHGEHAPGAEHGGEHAVHHPEPFNFADTARFQKEKDMASKGEKDEHGKVPSPVTPYAYLLLNAAILFFIYYSAGKKPIAAGLEARRATVAKELDEAAKIKAEAQARLEEYSERLDDLENELERIKKELIAAGEADRDRIVKEAEEKAERMRKDAQFLLDQEMKQLRNDLLRHTVAVATEAAGKVLQTRVSQQDHDRLADDYLKSITSAPAHGGLGGKEGVS